jgi:hypothetical protein
MLLSGGTVCDEREYEGNPRRTGCDQRLIERCDAARIGAFLLSTDPVVTARLAHCGWSH